MSHPTLALTDADWMRRAIALARPGTTWPNPAVGCVIVRDGAVVGEGATGPGGRPHAEEVALAQAGDQARGATAYVTLEPCGARSHGGPGCGQRLVSAGVARVVIACDDPSPFASGHGMLHLIAAGIAVTQGVLTEEAWPLCAGFVHRLQTGLPLIYVAAEGIGFDARFDPGEQEPAAALLALGVLGYTRLWVPDDPAVLAPLLAAGLSVVYPKAVSERSRVP